MMKHLMAAVTLALGAGGALAQAYPSKPVKLVVPSSGHAVNPSIYPTLSYDTLKVPFKAAWVAKAANLKAQ